MKIIVDVPHEIICKRYLGENDKIWMVHAVKNGKPLFDELTSIKGEMEDHVKLDIHNEFTDGLKDAITIINNRIENNC